MNTTSRFPTAATVTIPCLWLALCGPAFAHPGHALDTFTSALGHPFSGADHLLAMLMIGVWAAFSGRPAQTRLPLGFLAGLALGAGAGAFGFVLPGVETGVALSLLLLGALCAAALALPLSLAVPLAALLGLMHGNAHGIELGATLPALGGMLAGSVVLHGAGVMLGLNCTGRRGVALRMLAGLAALFGLWTA